MNPPTIKAMDMVNLAIQFAAMALAIGFPIWRLVATGRFWPSFLRMWLFLFIWALLFCMIIPLFITFAFHQKYVFERFPDLKGIPAMLIIGWVPCLILCSITWVIRTFWIQFRSRSKNQFGNHWG